MLPLDSRFRDEWTVGADPARRKLLRAAVLQQQRTLAHLTVAELWAQLHGEGEPWPED